MVALAKITNSKPGLFFAGYSSSGVVDIEIRVDSGSGYGELRGKRVPIIIRNL